MPDEFLDLGVPKLPKESRQPGNKKQGPVVRIVFYQHDPAYESFVYLASKGVNIKEFVGYIIMKNAEKTREIERTKKENATQTTQ